MILVDSNVWIFGEIADYPEHRIAQPKLEQLLNEDVVATNVIILSEVFHKLSAITDTAAARKRTASMLDSERVEYIPIGKQVAASSVGLAHDHNLRINDALIAAHALDAKAAVLTDDTKHFRRVPGLRVLPLRG